MAQKLQGTPGPLLLPFKKAQHSSLPLPTPLPSGCIMELPNFLGQEFSITVQYGLLVPEGCGGELALRTSWCSGGLREPSLPLSSGLWLAGQPCRYPLDKREKAPSSAGLLGILVGLTLKTKRWALTPALCSEHFWERLLPLSVQSKFVCRLVQYLLFWVGEKWKTTLGGNYHPSVSQ